MSVAVVWVVLFVVGGAVLTTWLIGRARVARARVELERRYRDFEERVVQEQTQTRQELTDLRQSVEAIEKLLRDVG